MGGAIALVCLKRFPGLFEAAILSAPMLGIRTGRIPRPVARCITSAARASGLGLCFVPGAGPWSPDRVPSPEISRTTSDPERCRLQYGWFSARAQLRVDQPTYAWLDASLRLVRRISRPEFLREIPRLSRRASALTASLGRLLAKEPSSPPAGSLDSAIEDFLDWHAEHVSLKNDPRRIRKVAADSGPS